MNTKDTTKPEIIVPSYRDNTPAESDPQDLVRYIHQDEKADYAFSMRHLTMHHEHIEGEDRQERHSFTIRIGSDFEVPFNAHFQSQASASLAKGLDTFTRDCLSKGRADLVVDVRNRLFRDQGDRRCMVRTIARPGNGMPTHGRALLSDAYRRIDDDQVFGAALPIIAEHRDKFRAMGGKRTDYKTHMKIISREPVFEIKSGDRLRRFHVGFSMSNSEVGCGFSEAHAFFSDSFCLNGCIFSQKSIVDMRMAHRGGPDGLRFPGVDRRQPESRQGGRGTEPH